MSVIARLSPHLADLIAAGEVVERPGSVIKELVENSIDAGATHITCEIQNGGMNLIRVTDDGCGMDRTDAQTAFLRHATSKLRTEEQLAAIGTLGFRGEALAAISAVSKITLLTCSAGSEEGTALSLEAGVITSCSPAGCPKGTTIIVRGLFYNTPARLKFMKSDVAEGANVMTAVQRLAIAHPEISFRFLRDGQEALHTDGDGKLLSVIYSVWGRQLAKDMFPVDSKWETTNVTGYISKPLATRGNRSFQMFYVNGRFVRSKTLTAALEEAYRNQMMQGRFPCCVLNINLPLSMVDVNVHPAKTELRFLNEKGVFDAVYYGVLGALKHTSGTKEFSSGNPANSNPAGAAVTAAAAPHQDDFFRRMDTDAFRKFGAEKPAEKPITRIGGAGSGKAVETTVHTPTVNPGQPKQTILAPDKKDDALERVRAMAELLGRPASLPASKPAVISPEKAEAAAEPTEAVFPPQKEPAAKHTPEPAPSTAGEAEQAETEHAQAAIAMPAADNWRVIGEALNCYILVEEPGALLLIDKHAAHERILFEKLKAQDNSAMSQLLLAPLSAPLTGEEAAVLLENMELLNRCGFEIEDFGDHTVLVRAIPDDINEDEAATLLAEIASDLLTGKQTDPEARRDHLLHTMACKAAIKAGWHTEPAERDALVREVMTREDLKYCPHGRPICVRLSEGTLSRQFKRS